jgi:recombinational DNA repair ATPase RecF
MSKPITRVQMTGFRGSIGSCELEFDPKKSLTMLFGENGSGKSTILDAIDVVCNDTVGCLDGISVGRSPAQYLCAMGCQPTALQVQIHSKDESWTGIMRRNTISVTGAAERPRVKVLRRNRILDLVLAQPSDRYKALRHFIDIATVEQSESTLQQKLKNTNDLIDTLTAEKLRMSNQLDNLWQAEGRPGTGQTAMAWAESKVSTGITALSNRLDRLKAVVDAISEVKTASADYSTRASAHVALKNGLETVDQEIAAAPALAPATAVMLIESLDKAKAYIEAEPALDKCPTCQRPLGRDELLAIVTQESSQLSELKTLSDRKQNTQRQIDIALSHLEEAQTALIASLRGFQDATAAGDIPEVAALNIAWPSWEDEAQDYDVLVAICTSVESVQAALEQQRDDAQRDVNQFNSVKEWWTGITDATKKLIDLDRIRTGLQQAFNVAHEKRVNFTQGILDGIRKEANRLFQLIHPGENIGLEQLKMEEARKGSVNQTGVFHGHADIPPQAVFSESHLDTLGFCVWLALAKRESPDQTVLLIDDIFSSVDSVHLSRVIDLLSAEAPNFLQVIVATHYRLWWDRSQIAQGTQRIHLGRWCATNGIAAQNMPLVTEQLRQIVDEPVLDRQAASSKAGILLESILDDLALLYECSLPRNRLNLYTLGALLTGCGKLFGRHELTVQVNSNWQTAGQPDDWQPTVAKDAYDRVNALQFIRNQVGCHFNPPGTEIPDDDVRDFGSATVGLVEALTCPSCGALATKKANDGTHLRCSCKKRAVRMTPVAIQ